MPDGETFELKTDDFSSYEEVL